MKPSVTQTVRLSNSVSVKFCVPVTDFCFMSPPFAVIVFVVVIKRINKKSQRKAQAEEEERNAMM